MVRKRSGFSKKHWISSITVAWTQLSGTQNSVMVPLNNRVGVTFGTFKNGWGGGHVTVAKWECANETDSTTFPANWFALLESRYWKKAKFSSCRGSPLVSIAPAKKTESIKIGSSVMWGGCWYFSIACLKKSAKLFRDHNFLSLPDAGNIPDILSG